MNSEHDVEFEKLLLALRLEVKLSFEEQVQVFLSMVTPKKDDNYQSNIDKVCKDLTDLLKGKFSKYTVYLFGSSVTNLNFINSDLDIYIDLQSSMDKSKSFRQIRNSISHDNEHFSIIKVLPKARVPIITCTHISTNIICDINLKNCMAVYNSMFVKYFLSLNNNFLPTVLILKYWAKLNKFVSANGFTSYSITMMFIFYIQISYKYPSVYGLQRNENYDKYEDGWNIGFEEKLIDTTEDDPSMCTIIELLKGFYWFCRNYEYNLYVICPYLGKSILKLDLRNADNLSDEFNLYKKNITNADKPLNVDNTICVQDPFDHLRNICNGVSLKLLQRFVVDCAVSYQILNKDEPSLHDLFRGIVGNTEEGDTSKCNVYPKIAKICNVNTIDCNVNSNTPTDDNGESSKKNDEIPSGENGNTSSNDNVNLPTLANINNNVQEIDQVEPALMQDQTKNVVLERSFVKIGMVDCSAYLKQQILRDKLVDEDLTIRRLWFNTFKEFIRKILLDVLKLNIIAEHEITDNVKPKSFDDELEVYKFQCTGKIDVIGGRKKIALKLKFPENVNNVLEKEEYLSNFVKNPNIHVSYDVNIILTPLSNPTEINLGIERLKNFKGCFSAISLFIIRNSPKWFLLYQRELNEQAKKAFL